MLKAHRCPAMTPFTRDRAAPYCLPCGQPMQSGENDGLSGYCKPVVTSRTKPLATADNGKGFGRCVCRKLCTSCSTLYIKRFFKQESDDTLSQHGIGNFDKASDVRAFDIVDLAIFHAVVDA